MIPLLKSPWRIKAELDTDRAVERAKSFEWDTDEQIKRWFEQLPCKHLLMQIPEIVRRRLTRS